MSASYIPAGFHSVTPSLTVADAPAALEFYTKAFGAVEYYRLPKGDKILHAEFQIGNSKLLISSEFPEWQAMAPAFGKGGAFMIYVPDADAAYDQAMAAGATSLHAPSDAFWGDRHACVADPFGYRWNLATHVRDLSPSEIAEAATAWSCPD